MIVIADTAPINYLVLIGEDALLPKLYGEVVIPPAVLRELLYSSTRENGRQSHWPDCFRQTYSLLTNAWAAGKLNG